MGGRGGRRLVEKGGLPPEPGRGLGALPFYAWNENQVRAQYGILVNLYSKAAATAQNSMTGANVKGLASYLPVAEALGRLLNHPGAALRLITDRTRLATKSRTISNYRLTHIQPENTIEINRLDARQLGLHNNDRVMVFSVSHPDGRWDYGPDASKPLIGRIHSTYHIRPGVITFELGHGHWPNGASAQLIDGQSIPGGPRRQDTRQCGDVRRPLLALSIKRRGRRHRRLLRLDGVASEGSRDSGGRAGPTRTVRRNNPSPSRKCPFLWAGCRQGESRRGFPEGGAVPWSTSSGL